MLLMYVNVLMYKNLSFFFLSFVPLVIRYIRYTLYKCLFFF